MKVKSKILLPKIKFSTVASPNVSMRPHFSAPSFLLSFPSPLYPQLYISERIIKWQVKGIEMVSSSILECQHQKTLLGFSFLKESTLFSSAICLPAFSLSLLFTWSLTTWSSEKFLHFLLALPFWRVLQWILIKGVLVWV